MRDWIHLLGQMHACLTVDEIVRFIAWGLVDSRSKATSVALACCSKSFEDPLLDTLWETQNRLRPLLRSLPGDVWKSGRCIVSVPTRHVFAPLNPLV